VWAQESDRRLTDRRATRARTTSANSSWRSLRSDDSIAGLQTHSFKLALVQMLVEGGRKEANLRRATDRIREAAASGAQVVVLPEAMTLGWTHSSAKSDADEIPGSDCCLRLREAARANRIYVCAGLVERAGPLIFNSAVLTGPDGELLLHHRKLNELEIAHDFYAPGDRLAVASTPLGKLSVMICADAFAHGQMISRTLGMMGADIILSPCAWAVPADHDNTKEPYGQLWLDNYCPVARDFRLWIAGVSNVGLLDDGPWNGRKCIGCSLVVGPDGREVLRGSYGADAEAILYTDIHLEARPARGDGWERLWSKSLGIETRT
jgi:predicted amidohydrolase